MADKKYNLIFKMSDGSEKIVQFTAPQGPAGVIALSKAIIGQVAVVKEVDSDGKPTNWEAVDLPVQSVNGKTGAVALSASDVNADEAGTADNKVSAHDEDENAHADIRGQIDAFRNDISATVNEVVQEKIENGELGGNSSIFASDDDNGNVTLTVVGFSVADDNAGNIIIS